MLKEIVQLILAGGMRSKQEIAMKIGVQTETLDDMLQLLTARGILRKAECESSGGPVCSNCPTSESGCSSDVLSQGYYVTDKGRRYAKS